MEYINQKEYNPNEVAAQENVPVIGPELQESIIESMWVRYGEEWCEYIETEYPKDLNGEFRIEFFELLVTQFAYPWGNFSSRYKQLLRVLFQTDSFQDLAKGNHPGPTDELTCLLQIFNGTLDIDLVDDEEIISIIPPKNSIIEELIFGSLEPWGFLDAEDFFLLADRFIDYFHDELSKLDLSMQFPLIDGLVSGRVKSITEYYPAWNIKLKDEDENSKLEEKTGKVNRVLVKLGEYPDTIYFSDSTASFVFGFRKIQILISNLSYLLLFSYFPDILPKEMMGSHEGLPVLYIPNQENTQVMVGKKKSMVFLDGLQNLLNLMREQRILVDQDEELSQFLEIWNTLRPTLP
jgi:hypothetical protein